MEEKDPEVLSKEGGEESNLPEELLVYMDGFRNEMEERLERVTEKISLLEQLFVKRVKDDEVRKKAFDELYSELQDYKRNFLAEAQKPLYKSLLLLYDTVVRQEETGADLGIVREELLEILHRQHVELIREQPEKFDKTIQMAIQTEETTEESEDQTVARVVRHGFRLEGQVLRPQEVVVRKYSG